MTAREEERLFSYLAQSIALLVVAQSLDFVTTFIGVGYFGVESETNRLLQALLSPYGAKAISHHGLGVILTSLVPFAVLTVFVEYSKLPIWRKRTLVVTAAFLFSLAPMIAGCSNLLQIWMAAPISIISGTTLVVYFGLVSFAWTYLLISAITGKGLLQILLTAQRYQMWLFNTVKFKTGIRLLSKRISYLSRESRRVVVTYMDRPGNRGRTDSIEDGLRSLLGPCGILLNKRSFVKRRRSTRAQSS